MNILLIGDSMIKRLEAHLSEDLDVIFYRGTTIERLTSRISKIKKHYDWILVHVGTNNISVDSVEIILQKYRSLANEILRVNPKARIIFSSIIPRDFNYFENDYWKTVEHIKILNHKIEAVNKALEKLCHNEDAFIFCSSNEPSWSGFLGKDGLHPNKCGDLRLANYFCRFLKKCISSDNASRKRKNCQLITSGYILDSLEFPPLPSCDQPSFLSSWTQHSDSAVPCSEVPTFVDPVPSYVSSFPSASLKDQKCQSIAPKFIFDSTEFPALSSSRQSSFLSSWSKHPASWPLVRPSVSACAVSTLSACASYSPSLSACTSYSLCLCLLLVMFNFLYLLFLMCLWFSSYHSILLLCPILHFMYLLFHHFYLLLFPLFQHAVSQLLHALCQPTLNQNLLAHLQSTLNQELLVFPQPSVGQHVLLTNLERQELLR
ncbi:uncharacterized protein LOC129962552 [Argiope bruennichi]|uniref:uncharacterized protein LOC129962552 n=1 Tax=Argiope bruennichi TaxID=94029 RepID=UPI0024950751|nr:uncharacterized protein LOC129962552 [Argiope bruennichi]